MPSCKEILFHLLMFSASLHLPRENQLRIKKKKMRGSHQ